jgi:hypothetical protein
MSAPLTLSVFAGIALAGSVLWTRVGYRLLGSALTLIAFATAVAGLATWVFGS